jgi:alpha-tubulin suppressor-like RCC1 family protein
MNGVLLGKNISAIATGWDHSVVLSSDGNMYAWGTYNHFKKMVKISYRI